MKNRYAFLKNFALAQLRKNATSHNRIRSYLKNRVVVADTQTLSAEEASNYINDLILTGKPFFTGRLGANELFCLSTFDFERKYKYEKSLSQMQMCAGFFPPTMEMGMKFKELMLSSIPQADLMGIWMLAFEDYYLNKYGKKNLKTTYLLDLEPWSAPETPWSSALQRKKVLVIHPFVHTIQEQYKKREFIFPGTNILPEFELKTLKAVQTIAGEKDERFETWFDALNWMYEEALKIDFDVAIIGCGAYGFPLAAKLKQAGKQAIHLGGATQLLFGIKGKRWEKNTAFSYVQKFFNEAWVYPGAEDKPKQANKVEGGCYW